MTEEGCVAVLKQSGNILEHSVIVFDRRGAEQYRGAVKHNVQAVAMGSDEVFLMIPNGVVRVNSSDGSETSLSCSTEGCKMLVLNDGRILLCSPQRAAYYRFSP